MNLDEQMEFARAQSKRTYEPITPALGTGTHLMDQRSQEGDGCLDKRLFNLLIPFGLMTLINDPQLSDKVVNRILELFS